MISYAERLSQLTPARGATSAPAGNAVPVRPPAPPISTHAEATTALVHDLLARTLGIAPPELRRDARFAEVGLNSLLGVRFLDAVNRALGLRIGVQALFEHSSPDEFGAFVAGLANGNAVAPAIEIGQPPAQAVACDIAIIGMSGRFASAPNIDRLWAHLLAGDCLVSEVPARRWDVEQFYDPSPGAAGKTISKWAGFLPDIDKFDSVFFGISPTEAVAMDPQQRLFLEEAWRTFENAGYPADSLKGGSVGVYVGAAGVGYEQLAAPTGHLSDIYAMTGNQPAMLASRIAYMLDLAGPAMTIDTTCSSSLVALDLACRALRLGEIDMALVGGVSLVLDEKPFLAMSRVGILSPDGRCKTFDDNANGIANGEAVAAVLLKPLARAQEDGDRIDAVIRACGTNQDGRSNGLTAPNPRAQAALMRKVYEHARIDPATIGLVEAHGTGTRLGDPIEVAALREVYGRGDATQCALGSIKSNLGHTSHAAGLAGLIKAALCLKHRRIIPTVNLTRLNARIDLTGSPFHIARAVVDWPNPGSAPRRAAVSAFGLSGTNGHAVLEEAPPAPPSAVTDGPRLIVLSARSKAALDQRVTDLAAWLSDQANPPRLADIAWTLLAGRTAFAHRLAFMAEGLGGLSRTLADIAAGNSHAGIECGVAGREPPPDTCTEARRWEAVARSAEDGTLRAALAGLAKAFVAGCTIDLADLHAGCSRAVSLPGYPFERVSYWPASKQDDAVATAGATSGCGPHPFLDAPLTAPNQTGFVKTFRADEPVVRDHVVSGTPILHAAVFLEMALAAAAPEAGGATGRLEEVTWRHALDIPPAGRSTELRVQRGREGFQCALYADGRSQPFASCRVSPGQGALADAGGRGLIDPAALQQRAARILDRAALTAPADTTVHLGPTFRGFDRLWLAKTEALSWLEGPIGNDCTLPPGVIDAAIQTAVLLVAQDEGQGMRLRYPVALGSLDVLAPVPREGCFLWARGGTPSTPDTDIVDVDVADATGKVCLRLLGLRLHAAASAAPPRSRTCRVIWRRQPASGHDPISAANTAVLTTAEGDALASRIAGRHGVQPIHLADAASVEAVVARLTPGARLYIIAARPSGERPDGDPHRIETSVIALLRLMQLVAARDLATAPIEFRIVTTCAYAVTGVERGLDAIGAALHGLGKAAARECPAWRVRLLDIDSDALNVRLPATLDWLATEAGTVNGEPVAWRAGNRWDQVLEPVATDPGAELRAGAVVLVAGGLGRVGRAVCEHLCRSAGARLVIVGRSELDKERSAFLDTLRACGGMAIYVRGDIANPAVATEAVAAARSAFGTINGIIQAVVDPVFGPIAKASLAEFRAALRPKLLGLPALHAAVIGLDLDFFAIFSSIGAFHGFPGNIGQPSYCVGCCFEAAYAANIVADNLPAKVIHWGLWDHPDYRADLLAQVVAAGTHVMPAAEASSTIPPLLATGARQVVHAGLAETVWRALGDASAPPVTADHYFDFVTDELTAECHRASLTIEPGAAAALDAYIAASLAAQLRSEQLPIGRIPQTAAALRTRLRVLPKYAALFDALLDLLLRRGLIESHADGFAATPDNAIAAAAGLARFKADPAAASVLALLDPCLDALPGVLRGDLPATDVLFPGGGMGRVEPIYQDQPILAFCNKLIASAVSAVAARSAEPITVIEVGAGTGATSACVLRELAVRGLEVRYRYTDISPGFLQYGKTHHSGAGREFAILDLERDPATQGFTPGTADIVIAANVLHATRRISKSLGHVGQLLRPGGLLIASELTRLDDFATLTFGLLDGWWLAEDREVRLPHGPQLDPARWEWQLRTSGFNRVGTFTLPGFDDPGTFPHTVIVAALPENEPANRARPSAPTSVQPVVPASGKELLDPITDAVRACVATALGLAVATIDPEQPYADLGVDSIIAPRIAEDINRALGIELRSTDLYNYATTHRLAAHIAEKFPAMARQAENRAAPPAVASPPHQACNADNGRERIAIIGVTGRFPGAPDLDTYWANLVAGRNSIREVDRFDMSPYFTSQRGVAGKAYAKWGGLLDDHDCFDPLFFGITPAEAEVMDPQQRVLLETAWHALEDAGCPPDRLSGTKCGVFVGASANNYTAPAAPSLQTLGQSMAILSARIAYLLNLRGPAFPVDTGCSSSLVSAHLACQSLLMGESDLALAAGVSVNLISPEIFLYLCDAGMASPAGLCKTFDDTADGFVPGEGVGVLVLKRLSDAERDGDRIRAVILGSGVNQDGKTSGMTAPSAESQTALETEVYRRNGVDPATIGLIEAHGTGTKLGDPIEIAALTDAFAAFTGRKRFCAIGSVKTNIGHAMAAAGVAGLIKVILALEHRQRPPSLNFSTPNHHIDFENSPFRVVTSVEDWHEPDVRRGAVSSFGFSGTNAHVVLQEAPAAPDTPSLPTGPVVILLSARTEAALRRLMGRLSAWLRTQAGAATPLFDIAHTLAVRRTHFSRRRAIVADSHAALVAELEAGAMASATVASNPAPEAVARVGAAIRAGTSPTRNDLAHVAAAFRAGAAIDPNVLFGDVTRPPVALPLYPFERERYWKFAPSGPQGSPEILRPAPLHPLLDSNRSNHRGFQFSKAIQAADPWLRDHVVAGQPILPGAAIVEMMRAAITCVADAPIGMLTDIVWSAAVAPNADTLSLDVSVVAEGPTYVCRITSGGGAQLHASATGHLDQPFAARLSDDITKLWQRCPVHPEPAAIYDAFAVSGLRYGRSFQVIKRLGVGDREAVAELALGGRQHDSDLVLHPALLDGALQTAASIGFNSAASGNAAHVPFTLGRLDIIDALPAQCVVHARLLSATAALLKFDIDIFDHSGRMVARIHELSARPVPSERTTHSDAVTLLFRPSWVPRPIELDQVPSTAPMVLLGADTAPSEWWRDAGPRRMVRVTAGAGFAARGDNEFEINPATADDYARLWQEVATQHQVVFVLLWPWSDPPLSASGRETAATLLANLRLETGLGALFQLAKAAIAAGPDRARTSILYLGRGDSKDRPQQDAAASFARVLMAEHPEICCRVLQADTLPSLATLSTEAGLRCAAEPYVRYDRGQRLAREPMRVEMPSGAAPMLRRGGTCVISGGGGRLAGLLATYLVEAHGAKVALLGRNPPSPALEEALLQLEARGGEVLYLTADVTNLSALRGSLEHIRRQFGAVNGVIHAAGQLRDGFLYNKTAEDFAAVLTPKVHGAIYLDHLTRNDDLDVFVLFSSTAAELGPVGQGDYAAANGFLDGFAETRARLVEAGNRRGKTVSIGWPLWANGGMTPTVDGRSHLATAGLTAMPNAEGCQVLEAGLVLGISRVIALHGMAEKVQTLIDGTSAPIPALPASTLAEPASASMIEHYLKTVLAEVTKLRPAQIEPDQSFEAYGIDSMMVMRLNAALERDFPDLPKTLFFEYQTIAELVGYFQTHQAARTTALFSTTPSPSASHATRREEAPRSPETCAARSSDVAIIGVSGLYPDASDLDNFWENLRAGRDCITEIPRGRWPLEGFYDADRNNPATSYSKWGGFIQDADTFDTRFFNIAPNEAETIDPQARKFLEVAWATLEDAGHTRSTLFANEADPSRRKAGVFVGVMYGDYQLFGPEELAKGNLIGPNAAYWNLANRVSYFMNFHGPSIAVDTACSSSLSAIHLACQSLRDGDCSVALAGGVNLSLHPSKYWILSRAGFAASDGRCRSFGAGGDGYVPGEGIGCVLLKPLDRALADGDRIQGIIRGSGVNHGGKTTGYTVPNPVAQAALVTEALQRADVPPTTISYVEAHGTGTQLGDPIELAGLTRAFGKLPPETCAIGSVKSNIGHLESAAGIAGLTKVLLQFKHEMLVPTLHAEVPNPNLDFAQTPFRLQRSLAPWQRKPDAPRRAGISSFGAGGANAHLILEEPPAMPAAPRADGRAHLVPLSAATEDALKAGAQRLAEYLGRHPGLSLGDIAWTLQRGREAMRHRLAIIADSTEALAAKLRGFILGAAQETVFTGVTHRGEATAVKDGNIADDHSLAALGSAWVVGADDGRLVVAEAAGRRIALPTYAFAKRRCWVHLTPAHAPLTAPIHPFIDAVDLDFDGPRFRTSFSPESPCAKDHQVQGRFILPGAVLLEMGRAAVSRMPGFAEARTVLDLTWERPVAVGASGTELMVRVNRVGDGAGFEILSRSDVGVVHARGLVSASAPIPLEPPIDLSRLAVLCPRRLEAAEIYPLLAAAGVTYGPSLQRMAWAAIGADEAVAALTESTAAAACDQVVFPPTLMDAVFQLSFALVPDAARQLAFLPTSIRQVTAYGRLAAASMVHARRRRSASADVIELDFTILDATGQPLGAIECFAAKAVGAARSITPLATNELAEALPPLLTLRPAWIEMPSPVRPRAASDGRVVVVTTPDGLSMARAFAETAPGSVRIVELQRGWDPATEAGLADGAAAPVAIWFLGLFDAMPPGAEAQATAAEDVTFSLLRLLKHVGGRGRLPRLTVVTGRAQHVIADETILPLGAGLIGLAKAAAHERPGWVIQLVDIDPREASFTWLAAVELPDETDLELAVRNGRLLGRRLERVVLPAADLKVWKDRGVFLIAGGASGIGLALARHLAQHAHARVALLGRSPFDAGKARLVDDIAAAGGEAMYVAADLADLGELRAAIHQVRARFGHIDAVIHSALVMHDGALARLQEQDFAAVLRPKLRGLVNLAEVSKEDPPDWLLLMSSGNAYTANPGQSAYAAASSFADAFALSLSEPQVRVLNWGFWGETGRVATAAFRTALGRAGIYPIATQEGLASIAQSLAAPARQLFVQRVAASILEPLGVLPDRTVALASGRATGLLSAALARGQETARSRLGGQSGEFVAFERVNAYGRAGLLENLRSRGLLVEDPSGRKPPQMSPDLIIQPRYNRLASALLAMLDRAHHDAPGLAPPLGQQRSELLAATPAAQPYLALLDHCVAALPEVLTGRIDANAVLFPDGSAALVEAIYQGNAIVDAYQQVLADAVAGAVKRRLTELPPDAKVRIIEVGAGTGGTTAFVLAALAGFGTRVEYVFTDIGRGFIEAARRRFGRDHDWVRFAALDIETPPVNQGFETGGFDIAIAANVVHATRTITGTLNHLKSLLVRGGVLLLNEAVTAQDFNTLTFGLTPGWWLFEDADRRLPHAPLLDLAGWRRGLAGAGFGGTIALGAERDALQAIILSESDGFNTITKLHAAPPAPSDSNPERNPAKRPEIGDGATGHIEAVLRGAVASALHLDPDEVEADVSFADYGADSIISVDLVSRINSAFGIELKPTSLFNYTTIRDLAGFIAVEFADRVGRPPAAPPDGVAPPPEAPPPAAAASAMARANDAKRRTGRLRNVIRKRLDRPTVNREAEFLAREAGAVAAPSDAEDPASDDETSLAAVLRALERGEIGVAEAMRMTAGGD